MYLSAHHPHVFDSQLFRWGARASAATLMLAWLAFALAEAVYSRFEVPSLYSVYQGTALAVVFAGYIIGWRHELLGGTVAIVGTLAFFAVHLMTLEGLPGLAAAMFAVPGMLYLLAWHYQKRPAGGF